MRFLCKKCGAQSPGDISEVEIRDGALVFICKACGASATLVENRSKGGVDSAASGKAGEKGIVEPDEDELVDLGEATLSRMLGKKVRIVAAIEALSSPPASPADPGIALEAAVEPVTPPPGPASEPVVEPEREPEREPEPEFTPIPVPVSEGNLLPAFSLEPDLSSRSRRSRVSLAVAASVGLLAVATVALLEARPQRSPVASAPAFAPPTVPGSSAVKATENGASEAPPPEPAPADTPSTAPIDGSRKVAEAAEPAARIKVQELGTPAPLPAVAESGGPGIPAEQVDAAFFRVRPAIRMCAVQEQRRNPDARLVNEAVTLTVAPTGEVARIDFENHELAGTPIGACLAQELGKFRIGAFSGPPATVRSVLELARPGSPKN
jgi:hypothetical protein